MGWRRWFCIQGNDSSTLSCTSTRYSDIEVRTSTNEQGHGCTPRVSWIHTPNAVPVLNV
uniref:NADH-cytochrome b5 reductase n=1 Tax=Rhizophora mucronata TaxID=61149 RepID=A0A2P2KF22_RHIMU